MECDCKCNTYKDGKTATGSVEGFNISLNLHNGQTMDEVTFTAKFYFKKTFVVAVEKSAMTRIDEAHYVAYVDTSLTGTGTDLNCEITVANYLDSDYTNGTRKVVKVFSVEDEVVKAI